MLTLMHAILKIYLV